MAVPASMAVWRGMTLKEAQGRHAGAQATRERLMEAAEQVFADKGFYDAAVDEIVARSGTSKGSVYFHFPSKESLFLAVMEQMGRQLVRRVEREVAKESDAVRRLDAALETTVDTLRRHKSLAKLLLVKGYSMGPVFAEKRQQVFSSFAGLTQGLIEEAMRAKGAAPGVDARVAAYAWIGAVSEVVVRWLETGEPDLDEALPTLQLLVRRGIGVER